MRNEICKLTDQEYFDSECLNNSFLVASDRSFGHALLEKEPTKAMELGTLLHAWLLQHDTFFDKYKVLPDDIPKDGRLKIYKEFAELNNQYELISQNDIALLNNITNNLQAYCIDLHPYISILDLMQHSQKEIAIFFEYQEILCKAKLDLLLQAEDYNIIIEVKSMNDITKRYRDIKNFKYYRQAFWYKTGIEILTEKPTHHVFVLIEPKAPHGIKTLELNQAWLNMAFEETEKAIAKYKAWVLQGKPFELYENGIEILNY